MCKLLVKTAWSAVQYFYFNFFIEFVYENKLFGLIWLLWSLIDLYKFSTCSYLPDIMIWPPNLFKDFILMLDHDFASYWSVVQYMSKYGKVAPLQSAHAQLFFKCHSKHQDNSCENLCVICRCPINEFIDYYQVLKRIAINGTLNFCLT